MDDELREYTRTLFKATDNRWTAPNGSAATEHNREILDYFKALTGPTQTQNQKDTPC